MLLLLLSTLSTVGLAQDIENYRTKQREAYELLNTDVTAAYTALHDLRGDNKGIPDTVVDYTYKLLGIYFWNSHNLDSAAWYYEKAIEYNGDNEARRVGNLVNLAAVKGESGLLDEANDLLLEALGIYENQSSFRGIGKCYVDLANVYAASSTHDLAVHYLLKAIELYEADTSSSKDGDLALAYFNLANSYTALGDYEFALDGYDRSVHVLKQRFGPHAHIIGLLGKSYALSKSGQGSEALSLVEEAMSILASAEQLKYLLGYAEMHRALALATLERKAEAEDAFEIAFAKAIEVEDEVLLITTEYLEFLNSNRQFKTAESLIGKYQNLTISEPNDLSLQLRFQQAQRVTLEGLGQESAQLDVLNHIVLLKDSLDNIYDQFHTKELHQRYKADVLKKDKELQSAQIALLERKNREKQYWILISVLSFMLALGFGAYFWYTRQLRLRLAHSELNRVNEQKERLQEEAKFHEENAKLKVELLEKQKQELLACAMEMNAVKENIRKILADQKEERDAGKLKKAIDSLVRDQAFTERLLDKFKSIDPNFINALSKKFPELTKSELEFCALLKLGLHNKEIAQILQISHDSVIKKKYRLTQKLRAAEGMEVSEVLKTIGRP